MGTTTKRRLAPKVNHYVYGVMAVVIFMGVILGAQALGVWTTSGKVDTSGKAVELTGKDPAEIKGWMLLGDIATAYNVPLADIVAAFKLPSDTTASTAVKDLEGKGENFSTTTLKVWVAQKIGVAAPPTVSTPKAGGDKTKP
ncbi:MAG: hypothetical protein HXX08_14040 [Chloroflexi bacterium]|uniref:Uncharacterized protein n=1 Tax=Candidatus Chlorohelix allophototropha TaxID=3003348 RepID=A0A8T7M4H6_9CHLR|nr:hypothetical protein [Chloroflexota bacterium]WJW70027.1 hypothetical protein OZ401_004829 [Chloroflexota bacterium L227-S17]